MEYDLYSNDWNNIELLHSEHLHAETLYAEQMQRWALRYGRGWGVVRIEEDDFQVYGSNTGYELSLRYCQAITPQGYIVHIDVENAINLQGSNDRHRDSIVPVYLGAAVIKEPANTGSSQTGALLDRPVLQWKYRLSTEPNATDHDWIQVGRLRRDGQRFVRDEDYIPQCLHLRSHPALARMADEITQTADRALKSLERAYVTRNDGMEISRDWLALMGVMVNALAPAAALIDREMHPRVYLQTLAILIRTYAGLMPLLPNTNATWTQASDRIFKVSRTLGFGAQAGDQRSAVASTLNGTSGDPALARSSRSGDMPPEEARPGTLWWDVFDQIRQAIQALALLFESLTPTGSAPPPVDTGNTVVRRTSTFAPVKKI